MNQNEAAKYMPLTKASVYFGVSLYMLRKGVRQGTIPSTMIGGAYYIDVEAYQRQLDEDVKSRLHN